MPHRMSSSIRMLERPTRSWLPRMGFSASRFSLPVLVLAVALTTCPTAAEQSAADAQASVFTLLPGFDRQRLAGILESNRADDLAKLLSRMIRVSPSSWRNRINRPADSAVGPSVASEPAIAFDVGDAAAMVGTLDSIGRMPVEESLREYVAMDDVFVLRIVRPGDRVATVFTDSVPAELKVGDGIDAVGVVIGPSHLASTAWRWDPQSITEPGHRLLARGGFDLRELESLRGRNRQPLRAADRDAFYRWLFPIAESSARTSNEPDDEASASPPRLDDPVVLLKDPNPWIGRRFEMALETVQVTKVFVPDVAKQNDPSIEDYYFQIDAFAWLLDSEVIIKPAAGQTGEPVVFQNRFPVSVVARSVPSAIDPGGDFQRSIRETIVVDGWLFRLWSYETEATDDTDAKQFGPLVVAIGVDVAAEVGRDPAGVRGLGYFAAAGVSIGILGSLGLAWTYRRSDRRRKRRGTDQTIVIMPPGVRGDPNDSDGATEPDPR